VKDVELMEIADGEEARELAGDDKAKADAIGELGELVRGRLERAADDVPDAKFAAMWRAIDKGLDANAAATPVRAGFWRRVTRFFEQYRGHIIVGAASAGAVAALALVLRTGSGGGDGKTTGKEPINVRPAVHRPTEIEDLDTPGGTGMVFTVDDEDGSTTVIWVTPEDTVEGI
jgi:hypothetical protein